MFPYRVEICPAHLPSCLHVVEQFNGKIRLDSGTYASASCRYGHITSYNASWACSRNQEKISASYRNIQCSHEGHWPLGGTQRGLSQIGTIACRH